MRPQSTTLPSADSVLLSLQGAYYAATGLWPLVNLRTFERVTGPKHDDWLVKTAGALIAVIGGALCMAARSRNTTPEARLLGVGSAIALGAVDVVYAAKRRIAPIYLLDALVEAAILAGWSRTARRRDEGGSDGRT